VAGHGIQISKSSPVAATPNEPSNDNVIIGNTVEDAALDGINVLSSNRNRVLENTVSGSGRDGVRLDETDLVPCDDSFVYNNTSSDNSKWGLNIESPLCHETTAGANVMTGNGSGPFRDTGTGTVLTPPAPNPDYDGDTRPNGVDNCPTVANNRQKDSDGNGAGDHCDPGDFDRDGYSDENEARFIGTNADYACSVHWPSNLFNAPPSTNRLDVQDVTSFLSPVRRLNTNPGESGFSGRWDLQPGPGAFPDYINILDVTGLFGGLTGFPPMFGGAPAFNKTCPFPP
jgi:parallel beta-helix repeat protein